MQGGSADIADMAQGADEGFLDNVEARLFVPNEFDDENIKRKLIAPEQDVP